MSSSEKKGKVKIFRFDPASGQKERYDTFEDIPYEGLTVLNVLNFIYRERDTSLAIRDSLCTQGFCGGCAVMVNGKITMACHTLATEEMTIEPHPGFKIIKDLVCDWNIEEESPRPVKSRVEITIDKNECIECLDCVKMCTMKVFKVVNKRIIPSNPKRCMGLSCRICMDTCWRRAININEM